MYRSCRYYQQQNDSPGFVDLIDVQIMHKFVYGKWLPNQDFKDTPLLYDECLRNDTR